MTDEEKLRIIQESFNSKLMSVSTWADLKNMIAGITKTKVKNFIKANLQKIEQGHTDAATHGAEMATDTNDLVTEVDNI